MSFSKAVALITGGAQGLGKGFARAVLEGGGKVSLLDVREDVGHKTSEEFNRHFGSSSAMFVKCDVCSQQDVEAAFHQTYEKFGKLDIVVNNAGVATFDSNWQRTIDINLTAVMRCCLVAAKYLTRSQHGGHIINVASAAGIYSAPFDPAYVASKHGVVGLSRSLSEIWEPQSIQVSCLCPAFADTELVRTGQKLDPKVFLSATNQMGIMSVDDVVKAFVQLFQEKDSTGGVLLVTSAGSTYKFPARTLKGPSKL